MKGVRSIESVVVTKNGDFVEFKGVNKMDMPDEIYAGCEGYSETTKTSRWSRNPHKWEGETKYTRSDIVEAELTKLRNALDVAEFALSQCNMGAAFKHPQIKHKVQEALTVIKQVSHKRNEVESETIARGEG